MATPLTIDADRKLIKRSKCVGMGAGGAQWMSGGTLGALPGMDALTNPSTFSCRLLTPPARPKASKAATKAELKERAAEQDRELRRQDAELAASASTVAELQAALEEERRQRQAAEQRCQELQDAEQRCKQQERAHAALVKHEVDTHLARLPKAPAFVLPVADALPFDPEPKRLRLKLRGAFSDVAPCKSIHESISVATELPAGCRLIEGVIPDWALLAEQAKLEQLLADNQKEVKPIKAGQPDSKRLQLRRAAGSLEIYQKWMQPALLGAGELSGRDPIEEVNIIQSLPGCRAQKLHWDYDPAHVTARPPGSRKPASAFLALEPGTRLHVYDAVRKAHTQVVVPPGCMLIFEGDVAHAGMWYVSKNLRVHVYLDVCGVERKGDHTWFPHVEI